VLPEADRPRERVPGHAVDARIIQPKRGTRSSTERNTMCVRAESLIPRREGREESQECRRRVERVERVERAGRAGRAGSKEYEHENKLKKLRM